MILYFVLGCIIGAVVGYVIVHPKLKRTVAYNKETELKNTTLSALNNELQAEQETLKTQVHTEQSNLDILVAKKDALIQSYNELKEQAEQSSQTIYQQSLELAQTNFEHAAEKLSREANQWQNEAQHEYLSVLKDFMQSYKLQVEEKTAQLQTLNNQLSDLQSLVDAAVAANKRAAAMIEQEDFYKLKLTDEDVHEIEQIRSVTKYLRSAEPINKVIWKVYYEKPTGDLIGRVVGNTKKCGIYKITHLASGRCYVGQSVDIAERWKQHIKRGLGAEAPTRNKLYPAMLLYGPETFTFEIIEECTANLLDSREDYWQEYFKAIEFGYSIK